MIPSNSKKKRRVQDYKKSPLKVCWTICEHAVKKKSNAQIMRNTIDK